ncbi:MAG: glycosyltransferase family 9 protein [Candidatus Firestonebacteria bacterium]
MQIDKLSVKNILIIKFKAFGDIILSQPAIRAVKESYPWARVTVLINSEAEDILSGLDIADEILLFNKKSGYPIVRDLELIESVMGKKFDMVIDLYGNTRSALLSFLSGARYRVGMKCRGRHIFYNIKAETLSEIIYNLDVNLSIVKAAGAVTNSRSIGIFVPEEAKKYIETFWNKEGLAEKKVIGINPFASCMTRDWGENNYISLARRLKEKGFEIILLWGPGQEKAVSKMLENLSGAAMPAPKTSVKQLGALFNKLSVVVTPTTFTQHLGVAMGTPTVTICGATDQKAWSPAGNKKHCLLQAELDCMPCEKTHCEDFKCMKAISVDEVLSKVLRMAEK